ncbi:MAG: hypothetical protein AAFY26_19440 [Cyanobacteria bacterium J06638_22]
MKIKFGYAFTALLTLVMVISVSMTHAQANEVDPAIATTVETYLEEEGATVEIVMDWTGISASGNYAAAFFTEGELGGSVVLQREGDNWQIIHVDGGVMNASEMETRLGLPEADANDLWEQMLEQ